MSGHFYKHWSIQSAKTVDDFNHLASVIKDNRNFEAVEKLEYGDYGLTEIAGVVKNAIQQNKKIALYADYDVDGTMSCVSWVWFFKAIGFKNYEYYIPCRFSEGYGVNLEAVKSLISRGAQLIITMDTGITANEEAAFCKSKGVDFICTDHHVIQKEKMPDSLILNPKMHPNEMYQELCGCGITFVLLRKLGKDFQITPQVWNDILALCGMATICDVVPLNGVNHKLAKMGVGALVKSNHTVLKTLRRAAGAETDLDEFDIGFRVGPRINAVGRLEHAHLVIKAFVESDCQPLIEQMSVLNDKRKLIQKEIYEEALVMAEEYRDDPILFLGGDWHIGVVGIAASKIAEKFWKPTWLFNKGELVCKGSARSVPGFDVTGACMAVDKGLFGKFGGHPAAAGYSFSPENIPEIRKQLISWSSKIKLQNPSLWESKLDVDVTLETNLLSTDILEVFDGLKPFGNGFSKPVFRVVTMIEDLKFYKNKHTAVIIRGKRGTQKIMFFNQVLDQLNIGEKTEFLVQIDKNFFAGRMQLNLFGVDFKCLS